jgi:hypothetical protein
MLPLRPAEDGSYENTADILVGGGVLGTAPGSYLANSLTEIITAGGGESSSRQVADLNNNRWYSSGVLLPDGTVLALSGADKDEVIAPGTEAAVRQAELYDPAADEWTALAMGQRDRTYHNTAMLLPDGSVLVAGHSPINALYGPSGDNSAHDAGLAANNMKDPSLEVFKPPYLFRGDRPSISFVQKGIAWTESSPAAFPLHTPDAADVEKVVLVRLPSTTHTTDADMRAVELDFEQTGESLLHVTAPPNGNVAPPGHYYLFVLSDNGEGLTPSNARIVKVSDTPDVGEAIAPMGA